MHAYHDWRFEMLCPRCSKNDVTPGTGLCLLCANETSDEEKHRSIIDLIERDPLEFMSRVLGEPVNAALKGPSASGKSATLTNTLAYFPEEFYKDLTMGSTLSLVHNQESLRHVMVILNEAKPLEGDSFYGYIMRSLLSE